MAIIPHSFTGSLVFLAAVLTLLVTVLLFFAQRKPLANPIEIAIKPHVLKITTWLMSVAATLLPILVIFPNHSVALPLAFFVLTGFIAGLSVVYLYLGGHNHMLLAYALIVVSVSLTLAVVLKNDFAGFENFTSESLYSTGSLAAYQTASQVGGFYYYIPIGAINLVTLGEFAGLPPGLPMVISTIELTVVLLGLWVFFERLGLKYAYPGLFLIFSPELSFIDGRTEELVYVTLVLVLAGLAYTSNNRSNLVLLLPVILVGVFDHPIAPIAMIAIFGFVSLTIALRNAAPLERNPIVFSTIRIVLVVTGVYWFLTYLYSLLLPHAGNLLQASLNFVLASLLGNSKTVTGGGITSAIAPGYSDPAFRLFAFIWAAPVALAASPIFVILLQRIISSLSNRKQSNSKHLTSSLNENFALGSSLAAIIVIGAAYAAYATGSLQGQYAIPAGYFVAVVASGFAINQMIGSRRFVVVAIITVLVFSIALMGAYGPDWAPLSHPNFQVSATIHAYSSDVQSQTISSFLGKNYSASIYSDYDLSISGGNYKLIRAVISSIDQGTGNFDSFGNSLFILLESRSSDPLVNNQVSNSNVVYFSNSHFAVYTG